MAENTQIKLFEDRKVRSVWDEETEKWYFSIVDVVAVLTDSKDPSAYWRKLKQRLKEEGNETVTNCHGLKILAPDGTMRLTDVADSEQLFRLIQSIPSPKAEPFKLWLSQVGYERLLEIENPEFLPKFLKKSSPKRSARTSKWHNAAEKWRESPDKKPKRNWDAAFLLPKTFCPSKIIYH